MHGYGSVLSRFGVDGLTREYAVVAALMLMDAQPQLKGHVQGAVNLGGDADQLWQLFQTVRKLFEANALFDRCRETFESVIGKKASDMSFEEEQSMKWL
ncbi:MAG: hypothetical protein KDB07_09980 [Planctomycetes bacterium]|nr:hypothetical protein [Planctomycetota bacterium]